MAESLSGPEAESLARRHLEESGLRLVAHNYRCAQGEIDLIMDHAGVRVFVEVRFRGSARFGSAAESIDARKRARIVTAARHYLLATGIEPECRFDVVSIMPGQPIHWIRDAFQAD